MSTTASPATDLRYPIGRLQRTPSLTTEQRTASIRAIAELPTKLRAAVEGLSDHQLDTPYRPDGWTVRQLVHHVADSHMHAFARTRYALAERDVTITPYDESAWAELADMRKMSVQPSLALLDGLHARWAYLLEAIPVEDYARTIQHPANGRMTVDDIIGVYDWHGRHHTRHVTALRERMGW